MHRWNHALFGLALLLVGCGPNLNYYERPEPIATDAAATEAAERAGQLLLPPLEFATAGAHWVGDSRTTLRVYLPTWTGKAGDVEGWRSVNLSAESADLGINREGQPVAIQLTGLLLVGLREPDPEQEWFSDPHFGMAGALTTLSDFSRFAKRLPETVRAVDIPRPQARTATVGYPSRRGESKAGISLFFRREKEQPLEARVVLESGNALESASTAFIITSSIDGSDPKVQSAAIDE